MASRKTEWYAPNRFPEADLEFSVHVSPCIPLFPVPLGLMRRVTNNIIELGIFAAEFRNQVLRPI